MDNQNLLRLAAKAIGMRLGANSDGWHYCAAGPQGEGIYKVNNLGAPGNPRPAFDFWNPLRDDGEAFRLALRCGVAIDPRDGFTAVISEDKAEIVKTESRLAGWYEIRFAITRAAAQIGESMP